MRSNSVDVRRASHNVVICMDRLHDALRGALYFDKSNIGCFAYDCVYCMFMLLAIKDEKLPDNQDASLIELSNVIDNWGYSTPSFILYNLADIEYISKNRGLFGYYIYNHKKLNFLWRLWLELSKWYDNVVDEMKFNDGLQDLSYSEPDSSDTLMVIYQKRGIMRSAVKPKVECGIVLDDGVDIMPVEFKPDYSLSLPESY